MRDQKNAQVRSPQRVNAVRHGLERIDVEAAVGFIEDGVFRFEHGELQNLGALLFRRRKILRSPSAT